MRPTALILTPALLLAVVGCAPSPTAQLDANKDLIREFTAALNAADWDALGNIVADSFVRHSAATAGPPLPHCDERSCRRRCCRERPNPLRSGLL